MSNPIEEGQNPQRKKRTFDGSKQPMVALGMLNTSKAISNAFTRIAKRREWMTTREQELIAKFNSENAADKRAALDEANKLKSDNSKLAIVEEALKVKYSEVDARELEKLQDVEFPSIGLTSVQGSDTAQ
tara:strand:+ start:532 stop:921 length:390 start_codon:yes stop_codon:yes gene_type:complete